MKKVVVVSSSPRVGGNSELLAKSFAEGAVSSGNEVQIVTVRDLDLKFCTGCLYCQSHDQCVLKDKLANLYDVFQNADVLVFATPIYYYSVSGQLKTLLDRLNPLYPRKNKFKEVYLIATSADTEESAMDGAVQDIQGWVDCFSGVTIKGVLRGVGVGGKGEVSNTDFLKKAYEMGRNI